MNAEVRIICPTCGEESQVPVDDVVVVVWPHRFDCVWRVEHDGHHGERQASMRVRAVLEAAGCRRVWGALSEAEIGLAVQRWDGKVPSS
jgi:hypothetical protein